MKKELPSPELLRKLLRYEPKTGELFWRERPRQMFKTKQSWRSWNGKNAGKLIGTDDHHGYLCMTFFGKSLKVHRAVFAYHHGYWPEYGIDHIDGNKKNNAISNLRDVPQTINMQNASIPSDNKSGQIGVCWHKNLSKWWAYMQAHKKTINLGYYDKKENAIAARKRAEKEYGFHENHGRKA